VAWPTPAALPCEVVFAGADRRCAELAAALPANVDADGRFALAKIPTELTKTLTAARAERLQIVLAIAAHSLWGGVDNRALADQELAKLANAAAS
jgi:hypothetical protein